MAKTFYCFDLTAYVSSRMLRLHEGWKGSAGEETHLVRKNPSPCVQLGFERLPLPLS